MENVFGIISVVVIIGVFAYLARGLRGDKSDDEPSNHTQYAD